MSRHLKTTAELYPLLVLDRQECVGDAYSLNDDTGDLVRVGIGGGTAVLKVALAILGDLAGNTDGATTVGDTV
jgi:hypothetical protein